jgi:hypothetical protein
MQDIAPIVPHNYENGICSFCGDIPPTYYTEGLTFTLHSDRNSYTVSDYTGSSNTVIIPSIYNGLPVLRIGNYAFDKCDLKTIIIGNKVISIGNYAFNECPYLTTVKFGSSVTSIGHWAFRLCSKLTDIYFAGTAEDWCRITFDYNWNESKANLYFNDELVEHLIIPSTITSIKDHTFYYCSSIKSVVIPTSVKSIGDRAFYCENLTTVYYCGTKEEWSKISIYNNGNTYLTSSMRYYYSSDEPTSAGEYWHYNSNEEVEVWITHDYTEAVVSEVTSTYGAVRIKDMRSKSFRN